MVKPAERIQKLPRYLFAEIDKKIRAKQAEGVEVIKLGIGDPDMPTPTYIIERMSEEIRNPGNHQYPPDEGLEEFKEAVAAYYGERYGVELDPRSQVCPLIGSKEGIAHISFSFVDPGDLNLVPDPGYPVYGIGTLFAGGQSHIMPLKEENGFLPRLEEIPAEAARKAKLMFINYPNNPTGAVTSYDYLEKIVHFARKYDLLVCHDAAYSELAYDGYRPPSLLEVEGAEEVGLEFNSLSKTFNMTGWRVGYAVGAHWAVEVLSRFKTNIDSGNFKAVQYAGVEALTSPRRDDFIRSLRQTYQERRDVVVESLREMGWPLEPPRGSFYVWAPVPPGFTSSQEFVSRMLEETGVVITPGRGFGEHGEGYFRIALTVEVPRMKEAMNRLSRVVKFQ